MRVKIDTTKIPNTLHFEVQRRSRALVTRNRKKYCRKVKHKGKESN